MFGIKKLLVMQYEQNIIHRPAVPNALNYDGQKSLGHFIVNNLVSAGERTVMVCGLTGKTVSANELLRKSIQIANALSANGINDGDVVAIISENRFEFAYILLGTILINCTLAPLNHTYSETELLHVMNLSKPKFIFTSSSQIAQTAVNIAGQLSYVKNIIAFDDCENCSPDPLISLKTFTDSISVNANFEPTPVHLSTAKCLILCSSGTTGLSKGVNLSQYGILGCIRDLAEFIFTVENVGSEITVLGLLPMFHIFGIAILLTAISLADVKIVMLPKFDEKTFLGAIENYRCSVAFLVPPLFVFLAKNPSVDTYNLSTLRFIFCGAAPLSKELEQSVRDRLRNPKLKFKQGYALTELNSALMQKDLVKAGSVGDVNVSVHAKVIDVKNNALGPNTLGELCFKGNSMMMGYIDDESATKAAIDDDGWLHTGDIGYYDADLQFFIVDRIKELIKWKGFQVPPAGKCFSTFSFQSHSFQCSQSSHFVSSLEIEALLLTHPKIQDCGVIGKPDDLVGELALAFVVKGDPSVTESEIIEYVRDKLSPSKRLHGGVKFIDQIPKSPSGKVLRRELRLLLQRESVKSKL